ncbi:MAG: hypothetical protein R6U87_01210, partial [Thiohalospira sp.]
MRAIHALRGSVRAVGMVAAVALFAASQTVAADNYRPFVLAYTDSGTDVSAEAASVRERLEEADFEFLGEYPVSDDRHVIVVTHDDLPVVTDRIFAQELEVGLLQAFPHTGGLGGDIR